MQMVDVAFFRYPHRIVVLNIVGFETYLTRTYFTTCIRIFQKLYAPVAARVGYKRPRAALGLDNNCVTLFIQFIVDFMLDLEPLLVPHDLKDILRNYGVFVALICA